MHGEDVSSPFGRWASAESFRSVCWLPARSPRRSPSGSCSSMAPSPLPVCAGMRESRPRTGVHEERIGEAFEPSDAAPLDEDGIAGGERAERVDGGADVVDTFDAVAPLTDGDDAHA